MRSGLRAGSSTHLSNHVYMDFAVRSGVQSCHELGWCNGAHSQAMRGALSILVPKWARNCWLVRLALVIKYTPCPLVIPNGSFK